MAAAALLAVAAAAGFWWERGADDVEANAEDVLPVPPVPPRIAEGEDYDKCLAMLNSDPSGAQDFAESWAAAGGGEGATHCRALSDIALGDPEEGAGLLDQLAATSKAPPAARAEILGQAGQGWMMAAEPKRAYASADQALRLMPDDPDLLIDRAIAGSALDRFAEAADDLTRALETDPERSDALVLRAAAFRQLNQLDLAQDDVDRALALDGQNPDALLERGILRQRRGDPAGARQDWERAIVLSPDTPTGDLAQQNLALLEAGPDQR